MAPEEFLDDPLEVADLKAQIRQAHTMIENKRDLLQIKDAEIKRLDAYLQKLVDSNPVISINTTQTQSVVLNAPVTRFQASLNELIENLEPGSELHQEAEAVEAALDQVASEQDPVKARKSASVAKARRFVQDLGDDDSELGKTVKGSRAMEKIASDLTKGWAAIEGWLGALF